MLQHHKKGNALLINLVAMTIRIIDHHLMLQVFLKLGLVIQTIQESKKDTLLELESDLNHMIEQVEA